MALDRGRGQKKEWLYHTHISAPIKIFIGSDPVIFMYNITHILSIRNTVESLHTPHTHTHARNSGEGPGGLDAGPFPRIG